MSAADNHIQPKGTSVAQTDFTIADVLEWARTKLAHEQYDFCNSNKCALAQFGMATGRAHLVGPSGSAILGQRHELQDALAAAETFGELVSELEKLAPETVAPSPKWSRLDAYLTDIEIVGAEVSA